MFYQMRSKKEKKMRGYGFLITGVLLISLIGMIFLAGAVGGGVDELTQLEQEISDAGYSWLIDYNISYPYVSVFRQNSDEEIARFENVINGKYQIFLDGLEEGESYSVFDLRSFWDVGKIPYEILEKKKRIDEIRKRKNLNENGDLK